MIQVKSDERVFSSSYEKTLEICLL